MTTDDEALAMARRLFLLMHEHMAPEHFADAVDAVAMDERYPDHLRIAAAEIQSGANAEN